MTLLYYLLFKTRAPDSPASGIVILESRATDALVWDHLDQAWVYDPAAAHEAIFSPENRGMFKGVDRGEAERMTPAITGAEPLPDEETIRWLFRWKGEPPGLDPL